MPTSGAVLVLTGAEDASDVAAPALAAAIGARGRRVVTSAVDAPGPVHLVGRGPGMLPAARLVLAAPGDVATLALVRDGHDALPEQLSEEVRARPVPTLTLEGSGSGSSADPDRLADELSSFWDRWEGEQVLLDLQLTADTYEVSRARRGVGAAVENEGVPDTVRDDAELLTSELVTNALLHATPPVRVRLAARADALVVSVHDGGPATVPARRRHHGRGLAIVAGLATRCGQWTDADGTTTWFWLRRDQPSGLGEEPPPGSNASHGATAGAAAAPSGHESR